MAKTNSPVRAASWWVVVADEYRADFFSRDDRKAPLNEVASVTNERARKKAGDLLADKGGRAFDSHGQGRHTLGGDSKDPGAESNRAFAKEVAKRLGKASHNGEFGRLVVVAAPRFLGLLRPELARAGVATEREIDKEVTGKDPAFIQKLIDSG